MTENETITVNIEIQGNVSNSEITGISFSDTGKKPKKFGKDSLFTEIFREYFSLPSYNDIQSYLYFKYLQKIGKEREFKRVNELWYEILEDPRKPSSQQEDAMLINRYAITIHDVQIISFVSRNPGYIFNPFGYHNKVEELTDSRNWVEHYANLLTPSFTWVDLQQYRNFTVAVLGLGDVKFNKSENNLYLLNLVSKGENWPPPKPNKLKTDETVKSITNNLEKGPYISNYDYLPSYQDMITEQYKEMTNLQPLALGKELTKQLQSVHFSTKDVDEISLGGFPILVTEEVYRYISDILERYGAVAIEKITGTLTRLPQSFPLAFVKGKPRWCLFIESRTQLGVIKKPRPVLCSAWTMTIDDRLPGPNEKYLQWVFNVGVKNWIGEIENATEIINTVATKVKAKPLFEFDEERNWFGAFTPFTPAVMNKLYHQMNYKLEITNNFPRQDNRKLFWRRNDKKR